jgi:hypothetical protein
MEKIIEYTTNILKVDKQKTDLKCKEQKAVQENLEESGDATYAVNDILFIKKNETGLIVAYKLNDSLIKPAFVFSYNGQVDKIFIYTNKIYLINNTIIFEYDPNTLEIRPILDLKTMTNLFPKIIDLVITDMYIYVLSCEMIFLINLQFLH